MNRRICAAATGVLRELVGVEPIELPGGHFPMLERPAELAEALIGLAERPAPGGGGR